MTAAVKGKEIRPEAARQLYKEVVCLLAGKAIGKTVNRFLVEVNELSTTSFNNFHGPRGPVGNAWR